jgi:hypothetical protein
LCSNQTLYNQAFVTFSVAVPRKVKAKAMTVGVHVSYMNRLITSLGGDENDELIEVKLPLDELQASTFGRPVRDAGPVAQQEVNGLGFLLGDKKVGPPKLEIQWIKVVRAGN